MLFIEEFEGRPNRGFSNQKGEWAVLDKHTVVGHRDVQQDVFDIIQYSYSGIGGNHDFLNAVSVPGDCDKTMVIDTDDADDSDAAILAKSTVAGTKITALGTDGGKGAKAAMLRKAVELLSHPGHYGEFSGRLLEILLSFGAQRITNPQVITSLLPGKELKFNPDGSYTRQIGGVHHVKVMLGNLS